MYVATILLKAKTDVQMPKLRQRYGPIPAFEMHFGLQNNPVNMKLCLINSLGIFFSLQARNGPNFCRSM